MRRVAGQPRVEAAARVVELVLRDPMHPRIGPELLGRPGVEASSARSAEDDGDPEDDRDAHLGEVVLSPCSSLKSTRLGGAEMRGTRFVGAVVAVALTMPLSFAAVLGASGDSVTGHGQLTVAGASATVSITAQSDPGTGASGIIRIDRTGEHTFSGVADVDCLLVDGNRAAVGGYLRTPIPNPDEPGTFYQWVIVWVTDNGPPGGEPDTWNTGVRWGEPGTVAGECVGFSEGGPTDAGNFRVVDA
jgi:hypothetical protein